MNRILIVEDEPNVRNNIAELLTSSGYDVTKANNGIEAINTFKTTKPDLVLCDIMMPLMDGIEFYSVIRQQNFMVNIPFIFLTAKTDLEIQNKAMNLGVEDYILKPFDSRDLLNRIKTRLEKKERIDKKFDKLKDDISLYVPHELQTPIFPIIGYSEMILDEMDTLTRRELTEMVGSIHTSAVRLQNRMGKFNNFAELRIQTSEKYVNNHNDFIEKTTIDDKFLEILFGQKKNGVDVKIEKAELSIAKNDLHNLLFELIENAIKFTTDGRKIKVSGKMTNNKYLFILENDGELFNIKLIDSFFQPERKEKQQIGNGLGIAIISLIAKKYKLKIYSQNDVLNKVYVEFDI